ncbi:hypothetical protein OIB37_34915 [Streptomyces sp. NBC_00820]|uniref:hypothetical protein n=1 Tax=Streptomyces sp. NBC_00820 TaxID=2975842 RepID=UPI002ED13228|nr:hypothetical protein OIB37_34915 [Streptomyces sp. NBC_00820]
MPALAGPMTDDETLRAGDVLSIACPFTAARVERGVTWDHVSVRWPWCTGFPLNPGDGIPFSIELLMRPYAFLGPGDEVADAAGRAWRFDGPWDWAPFDGEGPGAGPEWPLVLLTRSGTPCSDSDAETVAAGTATGSHQETVRRWMSLTEASPTP